MTRFNSTLLAIAIALAVPFSLSGGMSTTADAQTADAQVEGDNTTYITAENTLEVADELALRQIIARLNHALDQADYALYSSFFSEEAIFDTAFGQATGPQQIAAALEESRPFITNKRHVAANLVISGAGDRAMVTSYLIVFERAESLTYVGSAVNVDTLERQNGEWVVVRHETELDPATLAAMQAIMSGEEQ